MVLKVLIVPNVEVWVAFRTSLGNPGMKHTSKVYIWSNVLELVGFQATGFVFKRVHRSILIGSTAKVHVRMIASYRRWNTNLSYTPLHVTTAKANIVSFSHITPYTLRDHNLQSIVFIAIYQPLNAKWQHIFNVETCTKLCFLPEF